MQNISLEEEYTSRFRRDIAIRIDLNARTLQNTEEMDRFRLSESEMNSISDEHKEEEQQEETSFESPFKKKESKAVVGGATLRPREDAPDTGEFDQDLYDELNRRGKYASDTGDGLSIEREVGYESRKSEPEKPAAHDEEPDNPFEVGENTGGKNIVGRPRGKTASMGITNLSQFEKINKKNAGAESTEADAFEYIPSREKDPAKQTKEIFEETEVNKEDGSFDFTHKEEKTAGSTIGGNKIGGLKKGESYQDILDGETKTGVDFYQTRNKLAAGKAKPGKAGSAEAGKAGSKNRETGKTESGKTESGRAESGKVEPGRAKSDKAISRKGTAGKKAVQTGLGFGKAAADVAAFEYISGKGDRESGAKEDGKNKRKSTDIFTINDSVGNAASTAHAMSGQGTDRYGRIESPKEDNRSRTSDRRRRGKAGFSGRMGAAAAGGKLLNEAIRSAESEAFAAGGFTGTPYQGKGRSSSGRVSAKGGAAAVGGTFAANTSAAGSSGTNAQISAGQPSSINIGRQNNRFDGDRGAAFEVVQTGGRVVMRTGNKKAPKKAAAIDEQKADSAIENSGSYLKGVAGVENERSVRAHAAIRSARMRTGNIQAVRNARMRMNAQSAMLRGQRIRVKQETISASLQGKPDSSGQYSVNGKIRMSRGVPAAVRDIYRSTERIGTGNRRFSQAVLHTSAAAGVAAGITAGAAGTAYGSTAAVRQGVQANAHMRVHGVQADAHMRVHGAQILKNYRSTEDRMAKRAEQMIVNHHRFIPGRASVPEQALASDFGTVQPGNAAAREVFERYQRNSQTFLFGDRRNAPRRRRGEGAYTVGNYNGEDYLLDGFSEGSAASQADLQKAEADSLYQRKLETRLQGNMVPARMNESKIEEITGVSKHGVDGITLGAAGGISPTIRINGASAIDAQVAKATGNPAELIAKQKIGGDASEPISPRMQAGGRAVDTSKMGTRIASMVMASAGLIMPGKLAHIKGVSSGSANTPGMRPSSSKALQTKSSPAPDRDPGMFEEGSGFRAKKKKDAIKKQQKQHFGVRLSAVAMTAVIAASTVLAKGSGEFYTMSPLPAMSTVKYDSTGTNEDPMTQAAYATMKSRFENIKNRVIYGDTNPIGTYADGTSTSSGNPFDSPDLWDGNHYNFTPDQLQQIANLCIYENGTDTGISYETCLIINKYELDHAGQPLAGKEADVIHYIKTAHWWAEVENHMRGTCAGRCGGYQGDKHATPDQVEIVRKILNNGMRVCPLYVDEHDEVWRIEGANPGIGGRDTWVSKQTFFSANGFGSQYYFYGFPGNDTSQDPFGYTPGAIEKARQCGWHDDVTEPGYTGRATYTGATSGGVSSMSGQGVITATADGSLGSALTDNPNPKTGTTLAEVYNIGTGSYDDTNYTYNGSGPITTEAFVAAVAQVYEWAHANGLRYGSSGMDPQKGQCPCDDGWISCDRLMARALYKLGMTDQPFGGITCGNMAEWLEKNGWIKTYGFGGIQRGSIVLVKNINFNYFGHTFFVVDFNQANHQTTKYDMGSDARIQAAQPFVNEPWCYQTDPNSIMVFNLPDAGIAATGDGSWGSASAEGYNAGENIPVIPCTKATLVGKDGGTIDLDTESIEKSGVTNFTWNETYTGDVYKEVELLRDIKFEKVPTGNIPDPEEEDDDSEIVDTTDDEEEYDIEGYDNEDEETDEYDDADNDDDIVLDAEYEDDDTIVFLTGLSEDEFYEEDFIDDDDEEEEYDPEIESEADEYDFDLDSIEDNDCVPADYLPEVLYDQIKGMQNYEGLDLMISKRTLTKFTRIVDDLAEEGAEPLVKSISSKRTTSRIEGETATSEIPMNVREPNIHVKFIGKKRNAAGRVVNWLKSKNYPYDEAYKKMYKGQNRAYDENTYMQMLLNTLTIGTNNADAMWKKYLLEDMINYGENADSFKYLSEEDEEKRVQEIVDKWDEMVIEDNPLMESVDVELPKIQDKTSSYMAKIGYLQYAIDLVDASFDAVKAKGFEVEYTVVQADPNTSDSTTTTWSSGSTIFKAGERYEMYANITLYVDASPDDITDSINKIDGGKWTAQDHLLSYVYYEPDFEEFMDIYNLSPILIVNGGNRNSGAGADHSMAFSGYARIMYAFLHSHGLSDACIAGIFGNLAQECAGQNFENLDPTCIESNGEGHGIMQWSFGRKEGLFTFAQARNKPWSDFQVQLDYLWDECFVRKENWYGQYEAFMKAATPEDAAMIFLIAQEAGGMSSYKAHDFWAEDVRKAEARRAYQMMLSGALSQTPNGGGCIRGQVNYINQGDYAHVPFNTKYSSYGASASVQTSGCGICSMAMVLSFYGKNVSVQELAGIGNVDDNYNTTLSFGAFGAFAAKYGIPQPRECGMAEAEAACRAGGIAIVHVSNGVSGHYYVIQGWGNVGPCVYDPGRRARTEEGCNGNRETMADIQSGRYESKGRGAYEYFVFG